MTLQPADTVIVGTSDAQRLRTLWDDGRLEVGQTIAFGGRCYVVRGFDPVSTHQRRIYVEDFATGAQRRLFIPER